MAMMAVWAAVIMTYGVPTGMAENAAEPALKGRLSLDMAPNSVDDMYTGCKDKMETRVKKEYLENEKNKDRNFTQAWGEAEKYYNKKWKKRGKRPSTALGKQRVMAIYVYTLDKPKVYLEFNNAVRTQKSKYKTTFRYHTLHFFLTDAVQTLNARKPEAERCLTGYRRVNSYFGKENVLNKEIRFGSFTSSSMGWYPSAGRFGDKSCFEIVTCSGADVSLYSKLGESEREVLIPPYEVFKVTKVRKRSEEKSLPCEVVYKVKSTGKTLSNLNCALV
ncbi:ecto-ADP-ribosyltransferase 5-like [Centroberyx gerrardi]